MLRLERDGCLFFPERKRVLTSTKTGQGSFFPEKKESAPTKLLQPGRLLSRRTEMAASHFGMAVT